MIKEGINIKLAEVEELLHKYNSASDLDTLQEIYDKLTQLRQFVGTEIKEIRLKSWR